MRFMITFTHKDGEWEKLSPAEREQHGSQLKEFMQELRVEKKSELVFLHPYQAAKQVRMTEARALEVHDGPVLKGTEHMGGYYIIEAESMDEAVEWARKGRFMVGANEVRQIADVSF